MERKILVKEENKEELEKLIYSPDTHFYPLGRFQYTPKGKFELCDVLSFGEDIERVLSVLDTNPHLWEKEIVEEIVWLVTQDNSISVELEEYLLYLAKKYSLDIIPTPYLRVSKQGITERQFIARGDRYDINCMYAEIGKMKFILTKCKRCGKLIISSTQNERKGDDKYAGICDNCITEEERKELLQGFIDKRISRMEG